MALNENKETNNETKTRGSLRWFCVFWEAFGVILARSHYLTKRNLNESFPEVTNLNETKRITKKFVFRFVIKWNFVSSQRKYTPVISMNVGMPRTPFMLDRRSGASLDTFRARDTHVRRKRKSNHLDWKQKLLSVRPCGAAIPRHTHLRGDDVPATDPSNHDPADFPTKLTRQWARQIRQIG